MSCTGFNMTFDSFDSSLSSAVVMGAFSGNPGNLATWEAGMMELGAWLWALVIVLVGVQALEALGNARKVGHVAKAPVIHVPAEDPWKVIAVEASMHRLAYKSA